ncbi:MAG: nucleotidyltransferase domain-containing protein [Saprospiraceae bacterium]|nr:nucleotidyltransferase domain-containing protein [Saprospiraceae bacterium]
METLIKTHLADLERQHDIKILYLSMASSNFRKYLRRDLVWMKKYLYVLRPVLACMWIERTNTIAPTEFQKLFEAEVPEGSLKSEIEKLLARKMGGDKLGEEPRIGPLNDFLEEKNRVLHRIPERIQFSQTA